MRLLAVVPHQSTGTGDDRVARSGDQSVYLPEGCLEPAHPPVSLGGIEPADDAANALTIRFECPAISLPSSATMRGKGQPNFAILPAILAT
jgi:hypothetical protein